MGGVFGAVGFKDRQSLAQMAQRLAHRGTEYEIREAADGVFLGCCFDPPEEGIVELGRHTMAADMAVYNEPALRAALEGAGRRPLDTTAAVVLAAYRQFGPAALAQVEGDFALALWDDEAQELSLARDFAGSLPLYFAQLPSGGVVFASEYKAILAASGIGIDVDLDMVQYLQHHKYLPSARTLLKGIRAAPAGAVLTFASDGSARKHGRMPPLRCDVDQTSLDESCEKIANAFMQAMEARVAGRSAVGVALSGGIDSISVACACRRINPGGTIHTFTSGHGAEDPEIRTAEFVADKIGATQHNVIVDPAQMAASLGPMIWHLETPIARTEVLQFYELGKAARGMVDLILTGVVSDGLFAGLPRHKVLWLFKILPFLRGPLREFYSLTQSGRPPEGLLGRLMDRLYYRGAVPQVPRVSGSQYRPQQPDLPPMGKEFVNEVTRATLQEASASWLPKVERPLRAAGLRYASPFLDRNFMQVAFTIPSNQKIRLGKEKYVLRRALRQLVPQEVVNIPKFPMIMKHDATFSDALDGVADIVLSKERVEGRGFMAFAEVRKLRQRRARGAYSSEGAMRLWTALLTEIWAETFLDLRGERPVALPPA